MPNAFFDGGAALFGGGDMGQLLMSSLCLIVLAIATCVSTYFLARELIGVWLSFVRIALLLFLITAMVRWSLTFFDSVSAHPLAQKIIETAVVDKESVVAAVANCNRQWWRLVGWRTEG